MSRPQLATRPSSILTNEKTIVLVTGANTGIGFEIVKALATSHPNYQVLMGCRDTHKGEAAVASMGAPLNVNPIQLDITDDASIDRCVKAVTQLFGRLDILINNAGTGSRVAEKEGIVSGSRRCWEYVLNVNLISTGVFTEAMIPLLQKSKLAKIIFMTSELGSIGSLLNGYQLVEQPEYNASKSGVNMLTAYYATKYPNFRVNACCPGYRITGLTSDTEPAREDDPMHPRHGALNAVRLATDGPGGATATFSSSEGPIPW